MTSGNRTLRLAALTLCAGMTLGNGAGGGQATATVTLTSYDFRPQSGSYNAEWPGPPRHRLRYDEVKHYVPTFSVRTPPSRQITVNFWIREERTLWDATLGMLTAEFNPSGTVTIRYPSRSGAGQAPENAPAQTTGTFWLGCTERGRVRGNEGHGDDAHARVYLEMFTVATGGTPYGPRHSASHDVRCVE